MTRYILAVIIAIAWLAAAADEPSPQALTPDQEVAGLKSAEATGLAIFQHDRAAAVATDAAFQIPAVKNDQRVRGWVTQAQSDQIVVTIIDETPNALYRVVVSHDGIAGPLTKLEAPTALTPYEAGAAAARSAATAAKFEPCAEHYNTVVLPAPDAPQGWTVYLIPAMTQSDVIPMGGMYRLAVSGATVVAQRGFTLSCINLQPDPSAVALMITHLLDPIPTEAHVYWSLWTGKPIYVATAPDGTAWIVDGNKISLVDRKASGGWAGRQHPLQAEGMGEGMGTDLFATPSLRRQRHGPRC